MVISLVFFLFVLNGSAAAAATISATINKKAEFSSNGGVIFVTFVLLNVMILAPLIIKDRKA
jgi:hypothetical protein